MVPTQAPQQPDTPIPPRVADALHDTCPPSTTTPRPAGTQGGSLALGPGCRPVDDYELLELLGRGGFGEVWRARGPGGFIVALKFLRRSDRASAVELRSLELMKDIRHPHVLSLFGTWQRDDLLIIAMELAERSLLERWNEMQSQGQPGIPARELLDYLRDAARGIDYLNALGIQHRDIKPHNLLLMGGGVKVADFGLAKLLEQTISKASGAMTPAYAPAELFRGQATRWSDQYSLAVTYCELRGGRLPFAGNVMQIMTGHMMYPPDLTMLPEAERPIVARALAKNPEERWPDCRQFVAALAEVPRDEPMAAAPASPNASARRAGARKLIGIGGLTLLALTLVLLPRNSPPVPPAPEITNRLGTKLLLIPPGRFAMGSPDSDKEATDPEKPQHDVEITRAFYLGKYETTRGEFRQFVEATGYQTEAETDAFGGRGYDTVTKSFKGPRYNTDKRILEGTKTHFSWRDAGFVQTDEHPVVNVSWNDAKAFCQWLSQQEGRRYRLPTEAEWEYSCRAETTTRYASGDDAETLAAVANVADATAKKQFPKWTAIAAEDGYVFTAPIGQFQPNGFGLHDMHGNAWEWCEDWYDGRYYRSSPAQDPPGPSAGWFRVLRGGSFYFRVNLCRTANRGKYIPNFRASNIGFRVALVP